MNDTRSDNQIDYINDKGLSKLVKTVIYNASGNQVDGATEAKQDVQEETLNSIETNQTNGLQQSRVLAFNPKTTTYLPIRQDGGTNALQTINYEHHEIHAGSHYFVCGVEDLAINRVLDFTFVTPDTTKWIHLTWEIEPENETAWYIYEDAVIVNDLANVVTPRNNDRNSAKTSGALLRYEVHANLATANVDTDVTTATLLENGIVGSGKTAGDNVRDRELILKQNTVYCLRGIASTAGYLDFCMHWYEHTNVN